MNVIKAVAYAHDTGMCGLGYALVKNSEGSYIENEGGSIGLEIQNATITIGKDNKPITFQKSIQVHAGEKNIIYNRTFTNQDNYFIHEITVEDGNIVPKCTQQAIHDHLRVINTVPNFKFIVRIIFKSNCSNFLFICRYNLHNIYFKEFSLIFQYLQTFCTLTSSKFLYLVLY